MQALQAEFGGKEMTIQDSAHLVGLELPKPPSDI